MPFVTRVALAVVLASWLATVLAVHFGTPWARWLMAPALILTGWAAIGHLVTLDDDSPGGWSNPGKSQALWQQSAVELLAKVVLFGISLWLAMAEWAL